MPLWRIFAHPDTFSLEQRKGLSTAITKLYRDLPEFYVAVLFIEVKEDQVWVGGKSKSNFVRIVVEQIARQLPAAGTTEGQRVRPVWMNKINETLKPFIQDRKELEWELHIYETPMDLWRIQGLQPPPPKSEMERSWKAKNRPFPYENL